MELRFDLRSDQPGDQPDPGQRTLGFTDLTVIARRPRALAGLLCRARYDTVVVLEDELPKSGMQAGALVLAALARARRRRVDRPDRSEHLGRGRFFARAVAEFAVAVPRELWGSWALRRRAASIADARVGLSRHASHARSAIYLRGEATQLGRGALAGGATAHTVGVVNALVANGVKTEVFARHEPPGLDAPVNTVAVPRLYHFDPWLTRLEFSRALLRAADGESADFVYQRYALGSYAGLEIARRLDVPLVLEYNGSEMWIARHWAHRKPAKRGIRLRDRFERWTVREASLNVVASEPLRDELTAMGVARDRILVNPNGVDVDRLAPLRARMPREWRLVHELPDVPTIGFVGSFGPTHGVNLLPEMIDRVHALVPEAHWVIAGDGLLFGQIRSAIRQRGLSDRVFMPGLVPHPVALELLAASDVCVSPHIPNPDRSRFFFSPIKLFEYMGLGKAIVASDLEQLGEVLEHDRTGLLFTPGNAEEGARAVASLLTDEDRRSRLGGSALEEARRHYTWHAHVRRILEALRP
jgi:glycosyltransferase involved in cell wall biosynthesis